MMNIKNKSKSILNARSKVECPTGKEGSMINVDLHSEDPLGKLLSDRHLFKFKTWFGTVNSLKSYMDFISTPNYPVRLLLKKRLSKADLKEIASTRKISIPNFWALVVMAMIDKVKANKELYNLLKENDKEFTSIGYNTKTVIFGKEIEIETVNNKMGRYLAVIRLVEEIVKSGDIEDPEKIKYWVDQCKDKPNEDLFAAVPFIVKEKDHLPEDEEIETEEVHPDVEECAETEAEKEVESEQEEPKETVKKTRARKTVK